MEEALKGHKKKRLIRKMVIFAYNEKRAYIYYELYSCI